ncbi:MAG: NUDIX domain-containing protein [bacterium]
MESGNESNKPRNPALAVDAIVQHEGGIVLVKRKNPPYGWAIPGGFVEYGETVEQAVQREIREETGLKLVEFRQWHVFSDPDRDPRQHVVSVCFIGRGQGELEAATDAENTMILSPGDTLPEMPFDHIDIMKQYRRDTKSHNNSGPSRSGFG